VSTVYLSAFQLSTVCVLTAEMTAMCSHRLLEFHVNHSENIATVEAPSDKDEAATFNISQLAGKVAL
jgi:hypothetical protein